MQSAVLCEFMDLNAISELLIPCVEEGFKDSESDVVASALRCLGALFARATTNMVDGWTQTNFKRTLEFVRRAFPLICHPSRRVHNACSYMIAALTSLLGIAETFAWVHPYVEDLLECNVPPSMLQAADMVSSLSKAQVPQDTFDHTLRKMKNNNQGPSSG